ncbi:hypothetical protein BCR44DRAFT_45347, partial [Catenaria anguillulae PL171]
MNAAMKAEAVAPAPAETAASDLIPIELLMVVTSLSRPSLSLASASSCLTALLRSSTSLARNSWIQHLVFYDPEVRSQCNDAWHTQWSPTRFANAPRYAPAIGARHVHSAIHCFVCALKWNVHWYPQTLKEDYFSGMDAAGFTCGPQRLLSRNKLLDRGLVDFLIIKLVNARKTSDIDAANVQLCLLLERFKYSVAPENIQALLRHPKPRLKKWDPLFDLFTLCHFFMRSWDFDMLQYTLASLAQCFPSLPSFSLEVSVWLACAVDDHNSLGDNLDYPALGAIRMTFSEYFVFMAMSQWSVPMIETVLSALDASFQMPTQDVFDVILECLPKVSAYQRPARMLHWLRAHGFTLDPDIHSSLAVYVQHYSHFLDFFHAHDVNHLDLLRTQDGTELDDDIRTYVLVDGHVDALWVGLEYGLVSDKFVSGMILDLVRIASFKLLAAIVGVVAEKFGVKDTRTVAIIHSVFAAPTFKLIDPTRVDRFRDLLAGYGIPIE